MKKVVPTSCVLIPDQATKVFSGVIFDVYQWPQKMFDSSTKTFEMLKRADTVGAICLVGDKLIVVNEEQPNSQRHMTFPTGRVESSDLSLLAAAKREVLEETGYSFKSWRLVDVVQPVSKIEWFVHFYLAWDGIKNQPNLDNGEKNQLRLVDLLTTKDVIYNYQGYLGEANRLFKSINSLEQLHGLPEFSGLAVDR